MWTAAFAFAIALALDTFAQMPWLARSLYAVAIVAAASVTARRAWNAIRAASLDINVLMLVAFLAVFTLVVLWLAARRLRKVG